MNKKLHLQISTLMLSLMLGVSSSFAESGEPGPADGLIDKYRDQIKDITTKSRDANPEMKERAAKLVDFTKSEGFQAQLEENKIRLQLAYPDLFGEAPEEVRKKSNNPDYEGDRIFVFISKSVPEETLRNYMIDLEGIPQATAVIKGFVGGVKKMQPTIQFIGDLLKEDRHCKMPDCDFRSANIVVDPIIFERLKIDRVPAIAYIKDYERTGYCSEGLDDGARMNNVHIVYGDVTIKHALKYIDRKSPSDKLKSIIKKIKS